ncbi:MAG: hypothetical protein B7Z30_18665, partial [Rhizobiales bacterium 12-68-15]
MNKRLLLGSVFVAAAAAHLVAPVALAQTGAATAPSATAAPAQASAQPSWPRTFKLGDNQIQFYQPQALSWDGTRLTARAAFAVGPEGGAPNYGVATLSANAVSDDSTGRVRLSAVQVSSVDLPMAPAQAAAVRGALTTGLASATFDLLASDVRASITASGGTITPVQNPVPRIVFTNALSVLVPVSGDPVWQPVPGAAGFQRALNTQALLLQDVAGTYHLQAAGTWYEATALSGPWIATAEVPPDVTAAAKAANAVRQADPLLPQDGKPITPPPALLVSTVPTELIQTDGAAQLVPVAGTSLVTMDNADHA